MVNLKKIIENATFFWTNGLRDSAASREFLKLVLTNLTIGEKSIGEHWSA